VGKLNWQEIFERRPDLALPGYTEVAEETVKAWAEHPKFGKVRRGKPGEPYWTSIKHAKDD